MTMTSLFFYSQLTNIERKRKDPSPDTDDVFFIGDNNDPGDENDGDDNWPDEDEYRE